MSKITSRIIVLVTVIIVFIVGIYFGTPNRGKYNNKNINKDRNYSPLRPLSELEDIGDICNKKQEHEITKLISKRFVESLKIVVTDIDNIPLNHAKIMKGKTLNDFYNHTYDIYNSNINGEVFIDITNDVKPPWLIVDKDGYIPRMVCPNDTIYNSLSSDKDELIVKLFKPILTSIIVTNKYGERLNGVEVIASARWGLEARQFSKVENIIKEILYPSGVTDNSGVVDLKLSPNSYYCIYCNKWGYEPSEKVITNTMDNNTNKMEINIVLCAIVAGGILQPSFINKNATRGGNTLEYMDFNTEDTGLRPLSKYPNYMSKRNYSELLDRKLGLCNIEWIFAVEENPMYYPVTIRVCYSPYPGEENYVGEIPLLRITEITPENIFTPTHSIICDNIAELRIEFECRDNPDYCPHESDWMVYSIDFPPHAFSPHSDLDVKDKPDLKSGKRCYSFNIPAGKYRIMSVMGKGLPEIEPKEVVLHAGEIKHVNVNCFKRQIERNITIKDVNGLELKNWKICAFNLSTRRVSYHYSSIRNNKDTIRLCVGKYEMIVTAPGYKKINMETVFNNDTEKMPLKIRMVY